jgi:hypothetical protein
MAKGDKINICVLQGSEGKSLYVNDYRVSGSKPWGGGKIIFEADVTKDELCQALGITMDNI